MRNVGGVRVTGGSYPAGIWSRFMSAVHTDLPAIGFAEPDRKLLPKATYLRLKGERVSTYDSRSRSDRDDDGDSGSRTRRSERTSGRSPSRP